jgi:hypothetical protein
VFVVASNPNEFVGIGSEGVLVGVFASGDEVVTT